MRQQYEYFLVNSFANKDLARDALIFESARESFRSIDINKRKQFYIDLLTLIEDLNADKFPCSCISLEDLYFEAQYGTERRKVHLEQKKNLVIYKSFPIIKDAEFVLFPQYATNCYLEAFTNDTSQASLNREGIVNKLIGLMLAIEFPRKELTTSNDDPKFWESSISKLQSEHKASFPEIVDWMIKLLGKALEV